MSFTDQKQRVATEVDLSAPWSGAKAGKYFYCRLCGYQFQLGDKWRWVYNPRGLNLLVCERCDGSNDEVLERWNEWWKEWGELAKGKFRYIAVMLEVAQRG